MHAIHFVINFYYLNNMINIVTIIVSCQFVFIFQISVTANVYRRQNKDCVERINTASVFKARTMLAQNTQRVIKLAEDGMNGWTEM